MDAARGHFQIAVDDLARARLLWGDHADRLITHRHAWADYATALRDHPAGEIKSVIEWTAS